MEERTNADGDTTPHIVVNISTPVHTVNDGMTSGRQLSIEHTEMDIDSTLSTKILIPADLCVYPISACAVTSAGQFIPVPIDLCSSSSCNAARTSATSTLDYDKHIVDS